MRTVVVIGSEGLIGSTVVKALREVAPVITMDVGSGSDYSVDITSEVEFKNVFSAAAKKHRIDAVVNCAYPKVLGFGCVAEDVSLEQFNRVLNAHLGGYYNVMRHVFAYFKMHGGGRLLNFSSVYGFMAPDFSLYRDLAMTMPVEYAAIKSAIIQLTKYYAAYYQGFNIQVNCISPGGVEDAQPDVFKKRYAEKCYSKGMLDVSEVARTVSLMIHQFPDTYNGQNLVLDDGFSN